MQRNTLAPLLIVISIAIAAPALAAQGGNGNGKGVQSDTSTTSAAPQGGNGNEKGGGGGGSQPVSGTTSNIELASVNGAPTGASLAAVTVNYGDTLRFSTSVEKLAGWEWPMVALTCYQDVNGDGKVDTNLMGPDLVFGLLDHPDSAFALAGSSLWSRRGGDAVCRADLDAYGKSGASIRVLDSTEYWDVSW
jgi:hypothetical protein